MSDIRFNQWLHQSGTGGVSQSDGGHVGIGTTNPLIPVGAGNTHILNVGVVTCNNIAAGSSITATTYYGSGANLTSLPSQVTINNASANRVFTSDGGTTLNGEANLTFDGSTLNNTNGGANFTKSSNNYILVGSTNASGASLVLDGDSNGDGSGTDYAYLTHNTDGDLDIVVDNPANAGNIKFFTNSSSERLRIDSSGRLLIGTTTEGVSTADDLTLATDGNTGITIRSGSSSNGNIFFSDGTSGNAELEGYIQYDHSTNYMRFATDATERLRITSTGQLIQRYSSAPYNNRAATFQSPAGVTETYIAVVNTESNGQCGILFGDHAGQNAGNYDGYINYSHQYQHMAFLVNGGTERMRIRQDGELNLKRGRVNDAGHMTYRIGGRIAGTATVSLDIPVLNDGNIYWIEAFYTHHSLSYGGYLYGVYGAYSGHSGLQINNTIGSSTSGGGNAGTWSVSRGSAGTPVVVAKSAGSYGGMGYYWIHVHAGTVSNL